MNIYRRTAQIAEQLDACTNGEASNLAVACYIAALEQQAEALARRIHHLELVTPEARP